MGRLLLFENEELVARFRPHPLSYGRRYLAAFFWLVPGVVGAFTTLTVAGDHPVAWGCVGFATVTLLVALVNARVRKVPSMYGWFAAMAATGLVALDVLDLLPHYGFPWAVPLALGAIVVLLRLIWWELDRFNRLHFLTTERLVMRGGVGNRRERTLPLRTIQEVRSAHGPLGQAFDYGDLTLVLARSVRGKEAKVFEDTHTLAGIGRVEEVKHQLAQLVEEARLNPKDRRRRVDERRVKESMRLLAHWMRKGSGSRP